MEINGYPKYLIYDDGRIFGKKHKKFLSPSKTTDGYYSCLLYNKDGRQMKRIHNLLALHYILNPDNKKCVDHIDGNKLNNSITNLRWATNQENQYNTGLSKRNTSGFKGVLLDKRCGLYYAIIAINKKQTNIGTFKTAQEASNAYEARAKELHGEFYLARRV